MCTASAIRAHIVADNVQKGFDRVLRYDLEEVSSLITLAPAGMVHCQMWRQLWQPSSRRCLRMQCCQRRWDPKTLQPWYQGMLVNQSPPLLRLLEQSNHLAGRCLTVLEDRHVSVVGCWKSATASLRMIFLEAACTANCEQYVVSISNAHARVDQDSDASAQPCIRSQA